MRTRAETQRPENWEGRMRRHLHAIEHAQDLTCPQCSRMVTEVERLTDKLHRAHDDLLNAAEQNTATAREVRRLKSKLKELDPETTDDVKRILDFWAEGWPGAGRPNVNANGGRARLVRQALKLGHTSPMIPCPVHDEQGKKRRKVPEDAVCTVADELLEAVDWLKRHPFVGPKGRTADAVPGSRWFGDVQYALAARTNDRGPWVVSEVRIEQLRALHRRDRMSRPERLWAAYEATRAAAEAWFRLAVDALNTASDPVVEVDGVVTVVEGRPEESA